MSYESNPETAELLQKAKKKCQDMKAQKKQEDAKRNAEIEQAIKAEKNRKKQELKRPLHIGKPMMARVSAPSVKKEVVKKKDYTDLEKQLITYDLYDTILGMQEGEGKK